MHTTAAPLLDDDDDLRQARESAWKDRLTWAAMLLICLVAVIGAS